VSEPTRKKVQKILDQTHYVANAVARGLVLSSMRTIGILTNDVTSHYIATVVYTIEQRLVELGYNVILTNDGGVLEVKKRSLKMILEKQADGIIMVGSMYKEKHDNSHLIQAAQKVPILIVNNYFAVKNSYGIVSDDLLGVQNAVSYLVELGHRDIYYLCDSDTPAACAKLKGFQQGMRVYGLDESNWMDIPRAMQAGNDGLRQLLARGKRVTAVICGEDLTAVGVMKACAQLKLSVPGDISVIGYNNSILAEAATPALTSIDNHTEEIALAAADKLRDILQGKPVQKKTVFTPGLFVRESTGPVKR
jgi:LacI family transcriptional regulator